ncbi:Granule-bound starch synthase 2 [Chlorella vulgaris]
MLTLTMLGVGLGLSAEDFRRTLSAPGRLVDGLALQYAIPPLLALLIARLFALPQHYAMGLCLVACCPGGTAASAASFLARGDVPLSVAMTTASMLGAVVVTPLLTLAVLLPVLAGVALREAFPAAVAALRPLATLAAASFLALNTAAYVAHSGAAVAHAWPRLALAVTALHSGSMLAGYALSRALHLPQAVARSISLQAGMRNSALAAQLALVHFPLQPFAAVPALVSTCVHSLLAALLASAWQEEAPEQLLLQQQQGLDAAGSQHSTVASVLAVALARLGAAGRGAAVQGRDGVMALLGPRLALLRMHAATLLLEPPPTGVVVFDEPPADSRQPPPPRRPSNPHAMNIVMVGAECAPYSKTGGLGDVMQALPKALAARGHRVMSVAPRYKQYPDAVDTGLRLRLRVFDSDQEVGFFHAFHQGVDHVFVDHPAFHAWTDSIYGGSQLDVLFRCALLSKAALEAPWHVACGGAPYGDSNLLFIANDWHTALLPVYLQAHYRDHGKLQFARSLLVLHNTAHQGRAPLDDLQWLEVPERYESLFSLRDPQHGAHMNVLKAGAITAHRIVAVSSKYAEECQTPEGGWGLDDVLRRQAWKLKGVVNGIDLNEWHPAIDAHLSPSDGYCPYDADSLDSGKARCKAALQKELGLPVDPSVPLLAFIGRLDEQKGIDLIAANCEWLMAQGVQLVLLGSGRADLEAALREMEARHPRQCRAYVGFSVSLAHRFTAGADLLLMPSRFEPCGLNQLYAMAYGTPPVVHAVGGLADTVQPFNPYEGTGTGWTFEGAEVEPFRTALGNALLTYSQHPESFRDVQLRGMELDLSWDQAAQQYEAVLLAAKYQQLSAPMLATGSSDSDRAQAQMMEQVAGSSHLIEEMMTEISEELFVESAVSFVADNDTADSGAAAAVVRSVVSVRLEQLDATFLATLDAYIRGAAEKGAADVADVLRLVREEVLRGLSQRLPAEMQLLDAALKAPSSSAREAVLKQYALLSEEQLAAALAANNIDKVSADTEPASTSIPGGKQRLHCLASDFERAISQVIGDMELMITVPDRVLLLRLVLLREQVLQLLLEEPHSSNSDASGGAGAQAAFRQPFTQLQAVPKSCVVFLQRLVAISSPEERQLLLRHALTDDVERLPGAGQLGPDATQRERQRAEAEAPQDWVRPGRFMLTVAALQAELLETGSEVAADFAAPKEAVLKRLESVRRDALAVLQRLDEAALEAAAEGQPFLP